MRARAKEFSVVHGKLGWMLGILGAVGLYSVVCEARMRVEYTAPLTQGCTVMGFDPKEVSMRCNGVVGLARYPRTKFDRYFGEPRDGMRVGGDPLQATSRNPASLKRR